PPHSAAPALGGGGGPGLSRAAVALRPAARPDRATGSAGRSGQLASRAPACRRPQAGASTWTSFAVRASARSAYGPSGLAVAVKPYGRKDGGRGLAAGAVAAVLRMAWVWGSRPSSANILGLVA